MSTMCSRDAGLLSQHLQHVKVSANTVWMANGGGVGHDAKVPCPVFKVQKGYLIILTLCSVSMCMCACVCANVIPWAPSAHTVSFLVLELPRIQLSRLPRTGIARTSHHAQFFWESNSGLHVRQANTLLSAIPLQPCFVLDLVWVLDRGLITYPRPASNSEKDLELPVLPPPPLECWVNSCAPPHPVLPGAEIKPSTPATQAVTTPSDAPNPDSVLYSVALGSGHSLLAT